MMTDHRDPVLKTLFATNQVELSDQDGKLFTARVMAKTRKLVYGIVAALVALVLLVLASALLLGIPIQEVAQNITQTLAFRLFDFGNGWVSWVLMPVNNIASLLVLSLKIVRVIWKKVQVASF